MAVALGFEPTEAFTSHAFEVCHHASAGVQIPVITGTSTASATRVEPHGPGRTETKIETTATSMIKLGDDLRLSAALVN